MVFGVVLVEHAARVEGVVDAVAEHVAQLVLVHPAVQTEGGDDVDVVDAGGGRQVEHGLDDPLAVVGAAHLGQRQAGVVEHDRQLHVGLQQRRQRLHVDRIEQGVADRAVEIFDSVQRLRRVDHPAAVGRQLLEAEPLAAPEQDRRRRPVDLEHESRTWHGEFSSPTVSQVEGDLDGAAAAGRCGVGDGVDVLVERIRGRDEVGRGRGVG